MAPVATSSKPARPPAAHPATPLTILAILPMLACIGMAAWLYLVITPQTMLVASTQRTAATQTRAGADMLAAETLAHALAGGDYGEVQETLGRIESTKYLSRGLVINAANQVVATVGDPEGTQIGAVVGAPPPGSRRIALTTGGRALGQLWILAEPQAMPDNSARVAADIRALALFTAVFAALSSLAIGWLWLERHKAARDARKPRAAKALAEMPTSVLQARLDPTGTDSGPDTAQEIEAELRKRVAVSREKRSFPNSVISTDTTRPPG